MVGAFPLDAPTPYGRALLWAFDHFPGILAVRSGHKAGVLVALGAATLGAVAFAGRDPRRPRAPAPGGTRSRSSRSPPSWVSSWSACSPSGQDGSSLPTTAARAPRLLARGRRRPRRPPGRGTRPRPAVDPARRLHVGPHRRRHRRRAPRPSRDRAGAALDLVRHRRDRQRRRRARRLRQLGHVRAGVIGPVARRLGIEYVLLRNDLDWPATQRPPPRNLDALRAHPDLKRVRTFGAPGENVARPDVGSADEATLPPLELYRVKPLRRRRARRPATAARRCGRRGRVAGSRRRRGPASRRTPAVHGRRLDVLSSCRCSARDRRS